MLARLRRWQAEAPEVDPCSSDLLDAFWLLARRRGHGTAGPVPISMQEITAYLAALQVEDLEDRLRVIRAIDALDTEWLMQQRTKQKQQEREKPPASGRRRHGNRRPQRSHRR